MWYIWYLTMNYLPKRQHSRLRMRQIDAPAMFLTLLSLIRRDEEVKAKLYIVINSNTEK